MNLRPAAVAGAFYPGDQQHLRRDIVEYLSQAGSTFTKPPKAIIVPHAGYMYSGPIAASAYHLLEPIRDQIRHVILLGPAHTVPLKGLATPGVAAFRTPMGDVALDIDGMNMLVEQYRYVSEKPFAHAEEHSLEVQLPFLQTILAEFDLVPLVVGNASAQEVGDVIEHCWGDSTTLILVSSDLSHFLSYNEAVREDAHSATAIEDLDHKALSHHSACGRNGINGLLKCAAARSMTVERLDLRNSGDTAGHRDRVVGYGSWAFYES